ALDERWPQPPLYPADAAKRVEIEELEAWGDGPLQDVARRIILWALLSRAGRRASLEDAGLRSRPAVAVVTSLAWPFIRLDASLNGVGAEAVRAAIAGLPEMLDQVDVWIAEGKLGGDPPTAADYQLAGSLRMLLGVEDLAPLFGGRPAALLARRLIP